MNIIIHLKCVPIGALGPLFEGLKGIFSQRSLKIELIKGGGQTFFRAFINSELGPPEVALTQN